MTKPKEVERKLCDPHSGSRNTSYRKHWSRLIKTYGAGCYYCGESPSVIDHVIPVSYGGGNDFDNLVPSCAICNLIASDMVFSDVIEKQRYILAQKKRIRRRTRAICTECLLPYSYRIHSPSLFLCAECYDMETKGSRLSERGVWKEWIGILETANYNVCAHRMTGEYSKERRMYGRARGKGWQYKMLYHFMELDDGD